MVSLEQVKLLETKVIKTIEHVKKVTEENTLLKGRLDSCQQRIDELEVLVKQFREEESRIEDGILSALDRLNQFEDALERKFTDENPDSSNSRDSSVQTEPSDQTEPSVQIEPSMPVDSQSPPDPQNPDNELEIF